MKKLLYTFLAVSIIFSACKKEDEGRSHSIIGAWTINTVILESNISSDTLSPEDFMSNLDFTTNGILYETYPNGDIDTNEWVIIADSLHIGEGGEDFIGKHIVTATHLTLTGPLDENMFGADIIIMNGTRD